MDNRLGFFLAAPSEPSQAVARRYTTSQWEDQQSTIQRLYIEENQTTKKIVTVLEETGFVVTEKQLKDRLRKWSLNTKNVKEGDMLEIARVRLRRMKLKAKQSSFYINKKPLNDAKIDRFLKRNNISEDALLAMTEPVDASASASTFTVLTPPASNFEGETSVTQAENIVSSMSSRSPTPDSLDSGSCSAESQTGYWKKPGHWRVPKPYPLALSPPPPQSLWIENPPAPSAGWGLGELSFFDFDQFERDSNTVDDQIDLQDSTESSSSSEGGHCAQAEERSSREHIARVELEHGPEHAETLDALRKLAFVLYKSSQYGAAEALLQRVVNTGRKAFGNNHLATLESCLHLSIVMQEQGRYLAAESLQRETFNMLINFHGRTHKHTLHTQLSLAVTLVCQKRFQEAARLQLEVLLICCETFGNLDPFTLQANGDFGRCFEEWEAF